MIYLSEYYLNKLSKEIIAFIKKVKFFCESKKIKVTIKNWLEYKTNPNQFLPDNINEILGLNFPKYYLLTNIDFHNFLNSLPKDLKEDILLFLNIKQSKQFLLENLEIVDFLKSIQKKKYYNILKKYDFENFE